MEKPYRIMIGDNRVSIRELAENSVDAIVTDPPYELGFMGKGWDRTGIANDVKFWDDCLRVLKPGGHLLAFSGSRTYHRMTCAIEDAGFEIRDQIQWVYGSAFPKSLDVSKSIDKTDATMKQRERRLAFTAWVRSQGVTAKQINDATGTMMGSHYTTELSQPAVMTVEHLEACRHLFKKVPAWVEEEARKRSVESENFKRREVLSTRMEFDTTHSRPGCAISAQGLEKTKRREIAITAPATEAAKRWDGWGTALKPAHEPICVARKPLEGTVADNILKWGTGALNIDASRTGSTAGRWPANLIHDGSEEVLKLFPETKSGSAARFFYCPKASKKDRDEGCEGMPQVRESDREKSDGVGGDNPRNRTNAARVNHHPTVKPTDLMAYLCRLVTPPGGLILDPFMGSGSTGKAAIREGFRFVGMELSPEYAAIAEARIAAEEAKRR